MSTQWESQGHKEEGTSATNHRCEPATARGRRRSSPRRIGERAASAELFPLPCPLSCTVSSLSKLFSGPVLNAAIRQLLWKEGSILCRFDKDWSRLYLQVQPACVNIKQEQNSFQANSSGTLRIVPPSCNPAHIFLEKIKGSRDKLIDLINLYHSERIKLFILQFVQARESYGTSIHPARKGAGRNGKKKLKCAGTMCAIKESCCNLVRSPSLSCAVHLPSASLLASTAPALADDLGVEAIRSRR